jgi:hypothetical protein
MLPKLPSSFSVPSIGLRSALIAFTALFLLNVALSLTNRWPTPFVELDARIAPEFIYVWCFLLVWAALKKQPLSSFGLTLLAVLYTVLVIGRYFDTTAPALFGRSINLYWDGLQVPRLLWVLMQKYPLWVTGSVVASVAAFLVVLYLSLRWALHVSASVAAPYAITHRWALLLTGFFLVSSVANLLGVKQTWPYIARPVIPTYINQGKILWSSVLEDHGKSTLPASPLFDSDLGQLRGSDFKLFFLESYGSITYDNPQAKAELEPFRKAIESDANARGQAVASAFVTSTTFGGGTDLAHMALLSGIDTRDPIRHDVLLTTNRPTLVSHFKSRGFETFGFYPALDWEWPESSFFGYDNLVDGKAVKYEGPTLGYWKIPDQVALAKFKQVHPIVSSSKPRFTFFSSITSHIPFHPIPPYQPDWQKVLSPSPFDVEEVARLQNTNIPWLNMVPSYVGMIKYDFLWLRGYLAQPKERDYVMLVLGDHQPTSSITGEGASWDVPVHIIASRQALVDRFIQAGFTSGMHPPRKAIASMPELTSILLNALDSRQ